MGQFADETAVESLGDQRYLGQIHKGWRVGEVPNGGYVMSIAGQALRQALHHPDPLAVTAYFLAPTSLGPIDCQVRELRAGRNTSFAEADMVQGGDLRLKVVAAYTDLNALSGESWTSAPCPEGPSWDDLEPTSQKGLEFRERVELRLVRGNEVFRQRQADGSGEFSGWIQHRDGSAVDVMSLLLFVDATPPSIMNVFGPVGWVPTLELTAQIRAHPAPGPLQFRMRSRQLTRGVVEEDGALWDSSGQLVAISRQTAKFRLPPEA
ncbi:MAG: thioesterase family protein [Pseudomonadota bacterium]